MILNKNSKPINYGDKKMRIISENAENCFSSDQSNYHLHIVLLI